MALLGAFRYFFILLVLLAIFGVFWQILVFLAILGTFWYFSSFQELVIQIEFLQFLGASESEVAQCIITKARNSNRILKHARAHN